MRFKIYLILVFSFLYCLCLQAQHIQKNIRSHVQFLSSDALNGRLTGTVGERLATQYVADFFRKLGLEPAGKDGTFFQEFNFTSSLMLGKNNVISKEKLVGRNVLARLKLGQNTSHILIVGAHIDHLGNGRSEGSLAKNTELESIHYGADDNASGVASVLEVASKLSELKAQGKLHGNKDILFAAWSGEELGILGSSYFIKNYIQSSSNNLIPKIDAVINLDMVGHLRKNLVLQGLGSSSDWPEVINRIHNKYPFAIAKQKDPYLPTDSTAFYLHGIPIINFFTGAHENYHTPRDTAETLNYKGIKLVTEFLLDLILVLEEKQTVMNYAEVSQSRDTVERKGTIYLGTIPDYSNENSMGVKLSGVAKNSPAEKAGLQQDDVIIQLAGKDIHDIYDYTSALNALHVGKSVKLMLIRGKNKIVLTVIPRYRAKNVLS